MTDLRGNGACRGFRHPSRRQVLRAGMLGSLALGLPELLRGRALAEGSNSASGFGRAKSCILIFQWGGPSQLDTWDPKPDAPAEIRGEFKPIATRTPGVRISEHFPLLARRRDRLAIVRSMTHDDPAHLSTAHRLLTGHLAPTPKSDSAPPSPGDWPHLGALVSKLRPTPGAIPSAVNDALDRRPPRGARGPGPRPARRLARQGVRPVPRRGRSQRPRLPGRRPRPARRGRRPSPGRPPRAPGRPRRRGSTFGPGVGPPGTASRARPSTPWSRPRPAGPSGSTASRPRTATATAATSTASACCWPGGWSRPASAW